MMFSRIYSNVTQRDVLYLNNSHRSTYLALTQTFWLYFNTDSGQGEVIASSSEGNIFR